MKNLNCNCYRHCCKLLQPCTTHPFKEVYCVLSEAVCNQLWSPGTTFGTILGPPWVGACWITGPRFDFEGLLPPNVICWGAQKSNLGPAGWHLSCQGCTFRGVLAGAPCLTKFVAEYCNILMRICNLRQKMRPDQKDEWHCNILTRIMQYSNDDCNILMRILLPVLAKDREARRKL